MFISYYQWILTCVQFIHTSTDIGWFMAAMSYSGILFLATVVFMIIFYLIDIIRIIATVNKDKAIDKSPACDMIMARRIGEGKFKRHDIPALIVDLSFTFGLLLLV